jgi:hypothetical protein
LIKNRGGINSRLAGSYTNHAAVPPMPWVNRNRPTVPSLNASANGNQTEIRWGADRSVAKIAIQARYGNDWKTVRIVPAGAGRFTVPLAEAVAITAIDRTGNLSQPVVVVR